MSYLQEVHNEILALLVAHVIPLTDKDGAPTGDYAVKESDEFRDELLKYVKGKILESYKNGIEAAKLPPQGKAFKPREAKKENKTERA